MLVVIRHDDPGNCRELLYSYDPSRDDWRTLSGVPTPRGCFEGSDRAVWTGHELLLWGISNAAYDPVTDKWRHLPDPPAGAGGPSVVAWTGSQMIGWGGGCCDQELADGAAYTPATDSWRMLPPSPLLGRHATGAWTGTELVIAGGSGYDPPATQPGWRYVHFADAAAYDPASRSWRKLPSMPVTRGGDYEVVWDGAEVLVVGGTATGIDEPLARGVAYDPSVDRWRWLSAMQFPRTGFVSGWTGDQLVVWGGMEAGGTIPPYGESYDPPTNAWSPLPRAPLRARVFAAAVWSGTQMLIWGGADAREFARPQQRIEALFDGAALTPEWRP